MKIIYLHQYFTTPEMSGGTGSCKMAKRMVAAGHEVNMVTSFRENKKDNTDWFTTNEAGIRVHWYPVPYSNNMSFSQRIKAFLTFAYEAEKKVASLSGDAVFAISTPLTIDIPAVIVSKLLKIPIVFEVRDLWPEIPIAIGALKNPALKLVAKKLERWAYKNSSAIVALSPGVKQGILKNNYPSDQVAVIPNSSDNFELMHNDSAAARFRSEREWLNDSPLLVYTGTFGEINGVGYMASLASELQPLTSNVNVLLVGDGTEKLKVIAKAKSAGVFEENLFIEVPMPKKDIPALLSAATMASTLFIDLPEMRPKSANKFFDALASSTPIFLNYGGWINDLVKNHFCGLAMWQQPIELVAKQLKERMNDGEWLKKAGLAARRLAEEGFDRDALAMQLISVLELTIQNKTNSIEAIASCE